MKKLEVGDWIYLTTKDKTPEGQEPECVIQLNTVIITERKREREAILFTTDQNNSHYSHIAYFRYATEEEIKRVKLKRLFK